MPIKGANQKLKQIYHYIRDLLLNKLRQRKVNVEYRHLCVPADLGEDCNGYIAHIHIGKVNE